MKMPWYLGEAAQHIIMLVVLTLAIFGIVLVAASVGRG